MTKDTQSSKDPSIVKKLAEELLTHMGTEATVEAFFDTNNDAMVVTIISSSETGLLIGRKGETLSAIQTLLGVLLKQKSGEWQRVVVNVGDYREKEEDYLKNLGLNAANRAKETGEPQPLYSLNPAQRRIVHMALADDSSIITESEGDGPDRHLVIRKK